MNNQTVRFAKLVEAAGRPWMATLWVTPEKDPAFMRMVKGQRVLTVIQNPTSHGPDYGLVGFHPQEHAVFLVFPKRLGESDGVKVIGIKYDLLKEEATKKDMVEKPVPIKAPKLPKPEKEYVVSVLRTYPAITVEISVRAKDAATAKARALAEISTQPFPSPSAETVRDKVVSIKSD